ncbi:TPA: outer membrane porin, OprD family [Pseudomonas aeruginosa]|nr:outer membrane porin, OprD family [Pseudomonas aeruginosa]
MRQRSGRSEGVHRRQQPRPAAPQLLFQPWSFRIRQAWHRANADEGEGDQNEFRLIVDYPLSIL